jgi:holo-[acyl-carrier-protein] synthase
MIYGIGTDIVQLARIEHALVRSGERFARKILGEDELRIFSATRAKFATWYALSGDQICRKGGIFKGDWYGYSSTYDLA